MGHTLTAKVGTKGRGDLPKLDLHGTASEKLNRLENSQITKLAKLWCDIDITP